MKLQENKGTKDYLPEEQIIRNKIIDILRSNFENYGYNPIETSILEFWEVGANKYAGGDEILKETYKLKDQGKRELLLRYELTFKLAKLIGMNPTMRMPFKRYEIGKVFRDGPVKTGRLREFTQCDVDIIGVQSKIVDAELIKMAFDILKQLNLNIYAQVNSRQLLYGLFEWAGIKNSDEAALSLDKLEKIGQQKVKDEMLDKKINEKAIDKVFEFLNQTKGKTNEEIIQKYEKINNDKIKIGLNEIKEFMKFIDYFDNESDMKIKITPTLARGLGYYTGIMWEFFLENSKIKSSIAAGGRWDKMIQQFIGSNREYPATGISFGLATIQAAIEENKDSKNKIKWDIPKIYIIPVDEKQLKYCIKIGNQLRQENISCDIAYDKKLMKAINYADKQKIGWVIIAGEEEETQNKIKLKNMKTGKEQSTTIDKCIEELKK